jgi:hypothetical protein
MLIVDANGGSCHQFRWKIPFAGIGREKSRGHREAGPAFAGEAPLCYRCAPIAAIGRGGAERRESVANIIRRTPQ